MRDAPSDVVVRPKWSWRIGSIAVAIASAALLDSSLRWAFPIAGGVVAYRAWTGVMRLEGTTLSIRRMWLAWSTVRLDRATEIAVAPGAGLRAHVFITDDTGHRIAFQPVFWRRKPFDRVRTVIASALMSLVASGAPEPNHYTRRILGMRS